MFKVSIVVPVLDSQEIVRRQILHFKKMDLPNDVEIIYVDDGSNPSYMDTYGLKNFKWTWTFDYRPWTWALARNKGAKLAKGEYLLMTDLDYIIPKETILFVKDFTGQYMGFRREFGVLDENGIFTQDKETLFAYGLPRERYETKGTLLPAHTNNFAILKSLFFDMGGYREDRIDLPYPQGEDNDWMKKRKRWQKAGKLTLLEDKLRPTLYMFPNGRWCGDVDSNPFGLFHNLSRKSIKNPFTEPKADGSIGYHTGSE